LFQRAARVWAPQQRARTRPDPIQQPGIQASKRETSTDRLSIGLFIQESSEVRVLPDKENLGADLRGGKRTGPDADQKGSEREQGKFILERGGKAPKNVPVERKV